MKYGIYYAYWEKEWAADYVPYVEKVAKLDFDILEVGAAPLPDQSPEEIARLKKAADEYGIEITVGYGPTAAHNIGNPEVRDSAMEWYKRLFAVMEKLDSHMIGGALYSYWPVDYSGVIDKDTDWKNAVEGVRMMADAAAEYGVTLNMECLNRFENYILNTAAEGVQFCKEVDKANVGLLMDTFHMNIEETSMGDAIRTAGKYMNQLHTGECNRMVPGQGRMPWREIADAVRDIGFDGNIVMEPFVNMGGQVGQDIKIWRPICGDISAARLDQDAKDAVNFERYMFEGTTVRK